MEQQFNARLVEDEVQVGMFRVPVPNYDRRAFRESVVNAMVHRDYTRLGAVHVRWETDGLLVSNPGSFVDGVRISNLLVTEPRPRNPLLADAMKRIGLAERTGRGVDLIYGGLLRYGRPSPDYSRSDSSSVVLKLLNTEADIPFLQTILDEEKKTNVPMPVGWLIVLSELRASTRLDVCALAPTLQRNEAATRALLERMVETGLIDGHGNHRDRAFTLGASIYRKLGRSAGYVRQAGFDLLQQEQMVLAFARKNARISRKEVEELCHVSEDQSSRLLRRLAKKGKLVREGKGRSTAYKLP